MQTRRLLVAIALIAVAVASGTVQYPYSPANYFPTAPDLEVFNVYPLVGKKSGIPVPFRLGQVVFGPDGKSLYTTAGYDPTNPNWNKPGLLKVEFSPTRVSTVPGTIDFGITAVAVSIRQDKILISGIRTVDGQRTCGLFEVRLPEGAIRRILETPGCDYQSSWTELSVSPAGEKAVGRYNKVVQVIDLVTGTVRPIGQNFWQGSLSPDGKWIADFGKGSQSTLVLLDPNDLTHRRNLGKTGGGGYWSPDSRYLLLFKDQMRCGIASYFHSMETLEVETGKRSMVPSSQCKIEGGASGWVSSYIAR